jgi:hypothetical protein
MWLKKICDVYVQIFIPVIIMKSYKSCVKKSGFVYYASDPVFIRALGTYLHSFYKYTV